MIPNRVVQHHETALSVENVAILLIDFQIGAMGSVCSMPVDELKANAVAMARVATTLELPIVVARAAIPGEAGVLLPELVQELPDAIPVPHSTNNSWRTPEFISAVARTGRTHLAIAGVATDVGVCLTAISAVKAGYIVYVLVDASGTLNPHIEQAAWLRMMDEGIILTSWSGFTAEMQGDYTKEPGPELRRIIGSTITTPEHPFE